MRFFRTIFLNLFLLLAAVAALIVAAPVSAAPLAAGAMSPSDALPAVAQGRLSAPTQDSAPASVLSAPDGPSPILADFNAIAAAFALGEETVDVLVTLNTGLRAEAAEDWTDPQVRRRIRDRVRDRQDAALSRMRPDEFQVRRRLENSAVLSGTVSLDGLGALLENPDVASIELVQYMEPHLRQGVALINGMAFRSQYAGQGVSIAICDQGIDTSHPRLGGGGFPNAKVIGGYDMGEKDNDPRPDFGQAHGTACAGIAAGDLGDRGDYIGGVSHEARLYALKISQTEQGFARNDDIAAAWDWCVTHQHDDPDNPILVISTSFGGGRYFNQCDSEIPALAQAARRAVQAGITVVVSSGNDGYCDAMSAPACLSSVISVGAVYDTGFGPYMPCVAASSCVPSLRTPYCSTGFYVNDPTQADRVTAYSNTTSLLTLLGPAERCHTTDNVGPAGYSNGDYFTDFGGTSAACPYVAGAVASLQTAAMALTGAYLSPEDVRERLVVTGRLKVDMKSMDVTPRLDLRRAIDSLTEGLPTPDPTPFAAAYDIVYRRDGRRDIANIQFTGEGIVIGPQAGENDTLLIRPRSPRQTVFLKIPRIYTPGGMARIVTHGPVGEIEVGGRLRNLVARNAHVDRVEAGVIHNVRMFDAARSWSTGGVNFLSTDIQSWMSVPFSLPADARLQVQLAGVSLENLMAPYQIVTMNLASRVWLRPDGDRDVSYAHILPGDDNLIYVGHFQQVVTRGGGIYPHLMATFLDLDRNSRIIGRGAMFTTRTRGDRYWAYVLGNVAPTSIDTRARNLVVQANGGTVMGQALRNQGHIGTVAARAVQLPGWEERGGARYRTYAGGYVAVGHILSGAPGLEVGAGAPAVGHGAGADIGTINGDLGVNWVHNIETGQVFEYPDNIIQAGVQAEGQIGVISTVRPGGNALPYNVRQVGGPLIMGRGYSRTAPRLLRGLWEGLFFWSPSPPAS